MTQVTIEIPRMTIWNPTLISVRRRTIVRCTIAANKRVDIRTQNWLNTESKEIGERIAYGIITLAPEIRAHRRLREALVAIPVLLDPLPPVLVDVTLMYLL